MWLTQVQEPIFLWKLQTALISLPHLYQRVSAKGFTPASNWMRKEVKRPRHMQSCPLEALRLGRRLDCFYSRTMTLEHTFESRAAFSVLGSESCCWWKKLWLGLFFPDTKVASPVLLQHTLETRHFSFTKRSTQQQSAPGSGTAQTSPGHLSENTPSTLPPLTMVQ